MARRKHHAKKSRSRRGRVGAAKGGAISTLLFTAGGAVAAAFLVKALPDTMDDKIKAAIPLAAGIAVPMFVKGKVAQDVALGMGVQGALGLLKSFNVLSGIGGYSLPMIGATEEIQYQTAAPTVAGTSMSYTY